LTYPKLCTRPEVEKFGTERYASHPDTKGLFRHATDFYNRLEVLTETHSPWLTGQIKGRDENYKCEAYMRDPLAVLQEIFDNPALADKMVWGPRKIFDHAGKRVYTDLHTSDWWWETQVRIDECK
jgi:Plavaka transposase